MAFGIPKIGFIIILLSSLSFNTKAQISQPNNSDEFWDHVRFGGGIGLSFGDGFFSGTLAPSAIYEINPQLAFGVGLNGTLNKQKDVYKSTVLGGSLIALFNPIREIQLSAEFEELHVNRKWNSQLNINDQNYWYPALFIGAGFRSQNVAVGLRYDVLYDKAKSIYAEAWAPFIRVYF